MGAGPPGFGDELGVVPVGIRHYRDFVTGLQPVQGGEEGGQLEGMDVQSPVDALEALVELGVLAGVAHVAQPVAIGLAGGPAAHIEAQGGRRT